MAGGKRLKNSVYGFSNPLQSVNPLPVITNRDPTGDDISYPIGQEWINQTNNEVFKLTTVQTRVAHWVLLGVGATDIETLTGDVGGQVSPDALHNLNIIGGLGINTTGIPGTNTVTINANAGHAPISKYIVDPDGSADYTTIQAAINAANTVGIAATVYVRPAIYTENLTHYDGIDLWGAVGVADTETCKIIGVHTPPTSGTLTIRNIFLESATDIFLSAVAGTAALILIDCAVDVTNGYTFNCPNWTGSFTGFDIGEIQSTNDGWVNNTGGAFVFMVNITMGAGAGNQMIVSGTTELYNVHCQCPISFQGTGTATVNGGCWFDNTITTAATATVSMANSLINSGANQAVSHGSANVLSLSDITIDSSNATPIGGTGTILFGSVTFLDESTIAGTITQTLTSILKTGEIHAENIQNMMFSGRLAWSGAGVYYSLAATNFTLERPGTGYIKGKQITWLGSQSTGALSVGSTHYIYIDNTGTIGTTTTRSVALFQNNIVLFEALVDPNSVVSVVREDHPYSFPSATSEWAHDAFGPIISNKAGGANIVLNGTKGIQINGADELLDHGLTTIIPDSGGAAVNFTFMFTNGAGKWEIDSTANTFASEYNNAGTVTALGANKYGIFRLYVSKDDLNTSTPVYYAVLDDQQYNNQTAANTAIALNTPASQTNELAQMELAQLGFIIKEQSSDTIVSVIIEKDVGSGSTSSASPSVASLVSTDTANFDGWLSAADTTVQAALETLDEVGKGPTIDPVAATDSFLQYDESTVAKWRTGNDATDDSYRISQGNALGTNDVLISATSGEVTKPLQPSFMVWLDADLLNVTGDGTVYQIIYDTEEYDIGGNFNLGTGTFTAPVAGTYLFSIELDVGHGISVPTTMAGEFVLSNRTYRYARSSDAIECQNMQNHDGTITIFMDAADTLTVNIQYSGSTKNINIIADTGGKPNNWLSGCLLF